MIKLTRLAGESFLLNAELIRYVESRPDTFITLTTGERVVVQESMEEVMQRTIEYQRSKHLFPLLNHDTGNAACQGRSTAARATGLPMSAIATENLSIPPSGVATE